MHLIKRGNLIKKIEIVSKITLRAQECFLIVEYLLKNEDDDDRSYVKNVSSFFYYSKISYWQITVIELSKLFIEREEFNLKTLIRQLKNDGEFSQLKISEIAIKDWENKIKLSLEAITNLKLQRDKVYAHEDKNSGEIINKVSQQEVRELLKIALDIIRVVRASLDLPYLMMNLINSPAKNLEYCIEILAKERRRPSEKFKEIIKNLGLE